MRRWPGLICVIAGRARDMILLLLLLLLLLLPLREGRLRFLAAAAAAEEDEDEEDAGEPALFPTNAGVPPPSKLSSTPSLEEGIPYPSATM
jgi:hypothetical protein